MQPIYQSHLYKPLVGLLCLLVSISTTAQQPTTPKIKVLLLGSIHFTPSTQDAYQNKTVDIHDKQRQRELERMLAQLSQFKPNQICIEVPTKSQPKIDSQYHQYLTGDYKLGTDEIDQIAYPLAKGLHLPTLNCVNYRGSFDLDAVTAYAKANGQTQILSALNQFAGATRICTSTPTFYAPCVPPMALLWFYLATAISRF